MLFLLLALVEFVILFAAISLEKNLWANLSLVFFVILAYFVCKVEWIFYLHYIQQNWLSVIFYAVSYLAIGVIWSFPKWFLFLRNVKEKYDEKNKEKNSNTKSIYINNVLVKIPPQVSEHKARITGYITYWPVSILNTLLDDFVRRIITEIYNAFSGWYQKMSDSIFKV